MVREGGINWLLLATTITTTTTIFLEQLTCISLLTFANDIFGSRVKVAPRCKAVVCFRSARARALTTSNANGNARISIKSFLAPKKNKDNKQLTHLMHFQFDSILLSVNEFKVKKAIIFYWFLIFFLVFNLTSACFLLKTFIRLLLCKLILCNTWN